MVMALEDATQHRGHSGSVRDLFSKSGEKSRTAGTELWHATVWRSVSEPCSPQPYPVGAYPLPGATRTQAVGRLVVELQNREQSHE